MAVSSSSHLEDIDEKFCQCSICLQQYREPKLLPCLHRYCSDCLKQLIERNQEIAVISCPECRVEVKIPTEGVGGFKTDFHMKNIIEYIQIQKSVEHEQLLECSDCFSIVAVKAYCFKCNGFLCTDCHNHHLTKRSLQDHKQHTLSLEDLKSKNMTLEKLADLKEAPRCQSHLNDLCLLCCATCNELPICVTCVHGRHKNHDISDVKVTADKKREELQNLMKDLDKCREMLKMPQKVDKVRKEIIHNFTEKKENFNARFERNKQNVKKEIEKIKEDYTRSKAEREDSKDRDMTETKKQMDMELEKIKIRYEKQFEEIEKKCRLELDNLKKTKEEKLDKSCRTLTILEKEYEHCTDIFTKEQEKRLKKLQEISHQVFGIMARYENLSATGNSVLEVRSDWTVVQCIPDICEATVHLKEDMKREFPELENLSKTGLGFKIEEDEESPVNIDGIKSKNWRIDDITYVGDGSIVITGMNSSANYQSHITVINMNGHVLNRKQLRGTFAFPFRYCAYLSKSKIATVCSNEEIGVFDFRDYLYIEKKISDVITSFPSYELACCVTTDPVNNYIFVGCCEIRYVYVFDDRLNHHHTLTLPEKINYPRDMAFSDGKLIVCDPLIKKAYVVTLAGESGIVAHELMKPDCDGEDWDSLSVCTDSSGFIYILWMTGGRYIGGKRVIVQYTRDGQPKIHKEIDSKDARCITTAKTSITEKLLVATWDSGRLHTFTII